VTLPPPAEGVRVDWLEVPKRVRQAFERWTGSPVIRAISQPSGFSPGVAARLRLADGRRIFVKALGPEPNADALAFHRREARIVAALPDGVPVPRLRWTLDEGDGGWIVLAFDEVDGQHPAQPWRPEELDRVLDGLAELASALTPSPLSEHEVTTAARRVATRICGWQAMRDAPPRGLDAWSRAHLEALAELEAHAPAAVDGDTLLHFDVRADNVLLAADRVWFVDWPHASVGAAWFDVVGFAPSVTMQGGPPPEELIARSPTCRAADPADMTAGVAAIAGFFTRQALEPPPPGLPTLRAFQAAQGLVAREWLARRLSSREGKPA
jgi:aminoglycoside phosphotransferase (APT) family kinase protein